jgi:hypothetical protein
MCETGGRKQEASHQGTFSNVTIRIFDGWDFDGDAGSEPPVAGLQSCRVFGGLDSGSGVF